MPYFENIIRLLGILSAEQESYMYIDKLAYAPSKDLALYYLREALRDLNSLLSKTQFQNEKAKLELSKIDFNWLNNELDMIDNLKTRNELRERISYICSKALALAAALRKEEKS